MAKAKTKKAKVADYLEKNPDAKIADVCKAVKVSAPTVSIVKKELGLAKPRGGKKTARKVGNRTLVRTSSASAKKQVADRGSFSEQVEAASALIDAAGGIDEAQDVLDAVRRMTSA